LADYHGCVDFQVSGGTSTTKGNAIFYGGDYAYPGQALCKYFNTDEPYLCNVNEPCSTGDHNGQQSGYPNVANLEISSQSSGSPTPAPAPATTQAVSGGVSTTAVASATTTTTSSGTTTTTSSSTSSSTTAPVISTTSFPVYTSGMRTSGSTNGFDGACYPGELYCYCTAGGACDKGLHCTDQGVCEEGEGSGSSRIMWNGAIALLSIWILQLLF